MYLRRDRKSSIRVSTFVRQVLLEIAYQPLVGTGYEASATGQCKIRVLWNKMENYIRNGGLVSLELSRWHPCTHLLPISGWVSFHLFRSQMSLRLGLNAAHSLARSTCRFQHDVRGTSFRNLTRGFRLNMFETQPGFVSQRCSVAVPFIFFLHIYTIYTIHFFLRRSGFKKFQSSGAW